MKNAVLFRVDANTNIGTGHIMRCLALAQGMQERGYRTIFLVASCDPFIQERLQAEHCEIIQIDLDPGSIVDAHETIQTAKKYAVQWTVVDGYHFTSSYQAAFSGDVKLLFIDDYGHCDFYSADIVVNQNVSSEEKWYVKRDPSTQLLLGAHYIMLRKEFRTLGKIRHKFTSVAKDIVVTLGGGDPDNVTSKVLAALGKISSDDLRATILVGGSNPHCSSIQQCIISQNLSATILVNVQNMPALLHRTDLAVIAGGTTCYEMAFMGVPSLSVVIADNQKKISAKLDDAGVVQSLGWHTELSVDQLATAIDRLRCDRERRLDMSQRGQKLVDGNGVLRLMDAMQLVSL